MNNGFFGKSSRFCDRNSSAESPVKELLSQGTPLALYNLE